MYELYDMPLIVKFSPNQLWHKWFGHIDFFIFEGDTKDEDDGWFSYNHWYVEDVWSLYFGQKNRKNIFHMKLVIELIHIDLCGKI